MTNARTLPEATNRRAVLGAVLAAGAIGIVRGWSRNRRRAHQRRG
jgi:hypothetical protein